MISLIWWSIRGGTFILALREDEHVEETQREEVIEKMWDFLINNYKILLKNLYTHSQIVDGLGPARVAEKIFFNFRANFKKLPKVFRQKIREKKPKSSLF